MQDLKENESLSTHVLALLEKGYDRSEIERGLVAEGHDAAAVREMLQELDNQKNAKKKKLALTLLACGLSACGLALLCSLTRFYPHHMFPIFLYGLASLGALFTVVGLLLLIF